MRPRLVSSPTICSMPSRVTASRGWSPRTVVAGRARSARTTCCRCRARARRSRVLRTHRLDTRHDSSAQEPCARYVGDDQRYSVPGRWPAGYVSTPYMTSPCLLVQTSFSVRVFSSRLNPGFRSVSTSTARCRGGPAPPPGASGPTRACRRHGRRLSEGTRVEVAGHVRQRPGSGCLGVGDEDVLSVWFGHPQ